MAIPQTVGFAALASGIEAYVAYAHMLVKGKVYHMRRIRWCHRLLAARIGYCVVVHKGSGNVGPKCSSFRRTRSASIVKRAPAQDGYE